MTSGLALAVRIRPMIVDTVAYLDDLRRGGARLMFEGAQGALLDVDHGTYPYVTSSNTSAGAAATGSGLGPAVFDYVLGVVKAYATRVGGGPFPTELFDETGERLARVGVEFGSTTGRPRRCGWFDAVTVRRAVINSSVTGLCVTKLDVLDGLPVVKVCTGYRLNGQVTGESAAAGRPVRARRAGLRGAAGLVRLHAGHPDHRRAARRRRGTTCSDSRPSSACRWT